MSDDSEVKLREKAKIKLENSDDVLINAEHKIQSLNDLHLADHIVLSIDSKNYRHAILNELNTEKSIIEIIYYDNQDIQCNLSDFLVNKTESNKCGNTGVKKDQLLIDLEKIELYKVDYDLINEKCLTSEQTLKKANKFLGQVKYNVFANNDEHFSIFCKTGKAAKLFVINPGDLKANKLIGKSIPEKIAGNLAQEGVQILLVNATKHIATKFPRSGVAAGASAAAHVSGTALGIGLESVSMGYDIYTKHKELKEGKINDMKFKKYIARRVTRGVNSVAGGVAGGVIGQMVIPIPVVGAMVGGIIGGIVGAVAGQGEGILIGELVEVIDNKIKEKKYDKLNGSVESLIKEENDEKEKTGTEIKKNNSKNSLISSDTSTNQISDESTTGNEKTTTYEVLDKLVFKFEKDLLKPENWTNFDNNDQEKTIPIANKDEFENKTESNGVLLTEKDKINDEDYEIYVLNDSNEIVKDLNVEQSFDSNGAILKRSSLQAFTADQLPSNINIFFKILENPE